MAKKATLVCRPCGTRVLVTDLGAAVVECYQCGMELVPTPAAGKKVAAAKKALPAKKAAPKAVKKAAKRPAARKAATKKK